VCARLFPLGLALGTTTAASATGAATCGLFPRVRVCACSGACAGPHAAGSPLLARTAFDLARCLVGVRARIHLRRCGGSDRLRGGSVVAAAAAVVATVVVTVVVVGVRVRARVRGGVKPTDHRRGVNEAREGQ
jgi:hypothetical protein